jgi:hypothetical protein
MGRIEPPRALTKDEFDRRIASGAKTFEEIDPEFCRWAKKGERKAKFQFAVIVAVAAATVAIVAVILHG